MSQDTATATATTAEAPAATPPATPPAKQETATTTTTTTPAPTGVAFDAAQQAKVNDIVAAATRAEAAKYADAVAAQQELAKIREASATDQEKAVKAAVTEAEKATTEKFHGVLVDSQAQVVAASLGFHNPAVAVATLRGKGDLDGIKVSDQGVVDTAAVKVVLEALAAAETYLVKGPTPPATAAQAGLGGATSSGDKNERPANLGPGIDRLRYAYGEREKNKTT